MILEYLLISGTALLFERHQRKRLATQANTPTANTANTSLQIKQQDLTHTQQQHPLSLDPESQALYQDSAQNLNRDLLLYGVGLGAALLAPYSLIFQGLTVALVVGISLPAVAVLVKDFKARRYLTVYSVGAVALLALVAKGHFMVLVIGGIVGNLLLQAMQRAEGGTHRQLTGVFRQHPGKVWVMQEGSEMEVPFASLKAGDIVVVNAGEVIPVDGVIHAGLGSVDQRLLTGESQPVEREPGDQVFAATLLLTGKLQIEVQTAGDDTVAARIGQTLEQTQHYKENLIARGRQIADGFIPVTVLGALVTWGILGSTAAIAVLFSSLGLSMILLGPISVLIHLRLLARDGILVKDGRILEILKDVDTIVFDKTGTLTLEEPQVGTIHLLGNLDEATLLSYAAAAEHRQTHPIARAIRARAAQLDLPPHEGASYQVGYGIQVSVAGQQVQVGSQAFMQREGVSLPGSATTLTQQAQQRGVSLVYVAVDQTLAGVLELKPALRPEAAATIEFLRTRGMELRILSGDHEQPTRQLAENLGIQHYDAGVLPESKAEIIQALRDQGRFVCFIGDGINDAIALKTAQVSVSLQGASTAATDTAQIILMDGTLHKLQALFQQVDDFEQTMQRNYVLSVAPGVFTIAGIYLLDFRVLSAIMVDNLGALAGLANALAPLRRLRQDPPSHT